MNSNKPKRIVLHGCYSASNYDLKIKDHNGNYMKGEHDVFVMSKPDNKGFVKVKTITSIENANTETYQYTSMNNVKAGLIIPIPLKELNSERLCGIHRKPICIHKSKLHKSKNNFKYPINYNSLINIDKR